jgi:hypothetical protein
MRKTEKLSVDIIQTVPMSECTFTFFDKEGNKVPYGKHIPWLFTVEHKDIDIQTISKVELPVLDYADSNLNPMVKIHSNVMKDEKQQKELISIIKKNG